MSRVGRMPIPVPSGVEVSLGGREISVKGPKGIRYAGEVVRRKAGKAAK